MVAPGVQSTEVNSRRPSTVEPARATRARGKLTLLLCLCCVGDYLVKVLFYPFSLLAMTLWSCHL